MVRLRQKSQAHGHHAASARRHGDDISAARALIEVYDANIAALPALDQSQRPMATIPNPDSTQAVKDHLAKRSHILQLEKTLDFDHRCRATSNHEERLADSIIQELKKKDQSNVYEKAKPRRGFGGQLHPRFPGDHFLSNVSLIDETQLYQVARMMPKGAHLHIHFNACLLPHVLLNIAKGMERMFITSDIPLVPDQDFENFNKCEIQFSIMSPDKEKPGDLFSKHYEARQTMKFNDFLRYFAEFLRRCPGFLHRFPDLDTADKWLLNKLVFHEDEAYNPLQTASG